MRATVKETLDSVPPLVQKNNQLVEENTKLRTEIVNLQKQVSEEKKFNDDKYNFYIQHIMVLMEVEQWMRKQAQPWMKDAAEKLGKRIPEIDQTSLEELKHTWILDDAENELIKEGYKKKTVERIISSITPKGI
jgi:regulator of replication initiation timing